MPAPLPRRTPSDGPRCRNLGTVSDWEPFGTPSPGLLARSEPGLVRFLRRADDVVGQAKEGIEEGAFAKGRLGPGWDHLLSPMPPLPANPLASLEERRRGLYEAALEPPAGFTVVVYALASLNDEPRGRLQHLRAYAAHRGWRLHRESLWDCCGLTRPLDRTSWLRALELVAGGLVQGIVTLTRSAVSTNDAEYERALDHLGTYRAFLEHVPCEWQPDLPPTVPTVEGPSV